MHHGAVRTICGDRIERERHKTVLFPPESFQNIARGDLGDLFLSDMLFKPHHEPHHGDAVFYVCLSDILDFHRIFDGLHDR